jgi:hypothetical protein
MPAGRGKRRRKNGGRPSRLLLFASCASGTVLRSAPRPTSSNAGKRQAAASGAPSLSAFVRDRLDAQPIEVVNPAPTSAAQADATIRSLDESLEASLQEMRSIVESVRVGYAQPLDR